MTKFFKFVVYSWIAMALLAMSHCGGIYVNVNGKDYRITTGMFRKQ